MTKVFAYLRVCTGGAIGNDGFDRQEEACRAVAEKQGWYIARVFRESQSDPSNFSDSKLLHEAINLAGGEMDIKTIVVERAERLSYDLIISELLLRECRSRDIKVYAANTGIELVNDTGDSMRVWIRQILVALIKWEAGIASRKLQAGRKVKAALTGKPCGGSTEDRYGNRGSIAQQNVERRIIGNIIYWYKNEKNFCEISKELTARRIKIPNPHRIHRKDMAPRSLIFWTQDTVKSLYHEWVNTKTIMPFVGNHL